MTNNQHNDGKQTGGSSERGGKGSFANDPQRASEEGRKGGQQSHQGTSRKTSDQNEAGGSHRGGSGNFADDPQKASDAGRKGGQHSHKESSKE